MKQILIIIFTTFFLSSVALADLYEVTHVDSTDSLNMRNAARVSASIVTSLPFNATRITVLKTVQNHRSQWSKISWKGNIGWVNAYYLRVATLQTFQCSGAEPFWSLEITASNTVKFNNYDIGNFQAPISFQKIPSGRPPEAGIRVTKAVSSNHSALIVTTEEACEGDMSGITHAYSMTALINNNIVLVGCCSN